MTSSELKFLALQDQAMTMMAPHIVLLEKISHNLEKGAPLNEEERLRAAQAVLTLIGMLYSRKEGMKDLGDDSLSAENKP